MKIGKRNTSEVKDDAENETLGKRGDVARFADLARRHEIQTALFPSGLVFSPKDLFFEPRNHTLMQAVSELVTDLIKNGRGERI